MTTGIITGIKTNGITNHQIITKTATIIPAGTNGPKIIAIIIIGNQTGIISLKTGKETSSIIIAGTMTIASASKIMATTPRIEITTATSPVTGISLNEAEIKSAKAGIA